MCRSLLAAAALLGASAERLNIRFGETSASVLDEIDVQQTPKEGNEEQMGVEAIHSSFVSTWESLLKASRYVSEGHSDSSSAVAEADAKLAEAARVLTAWSSRQEPTEVQAGPSSWHSLVQNSRSEQRLTSKGKLKGARQRSQDSGPNWLFGKFLEPSKSAVSTVQEWAAELASVGGGTATINPSSSPTKALQSMVRNAKRIWKHDRSQDVQAWLHLMEMQLYQAKSHWSTLSSEFENLATNYKELLRLRQDTDYALSIANGTLSSGLPTAELFASYYIGKSHRESGQKTAIIFSCSYGGGHRSAAQAVKSYLEDDGYSVTVLDTLRDKDFRDMSGELADGFYNGVVLQDRWYRLFNMLDKGRRWFGVLHPSCPAPACNTARKDHFRTSILQRRPDVIVSVYHMDLLPLLEVSRDLGNIPLVHLGTDMDVKMGEVFDKRPESPHFRVGIPFDLPASWKTVEPVAKEQAFLAGYPVRKEFLQPRDASRAARTKAESFPAGAKVMLAMTGSMGQDVPWPASLANGGVDGNRWHIVVIAGHNNGIESALEQQLPDKVPCSSLQEVTGQGTTCTRSFMQGRAKEVTLEVAKAPTEQRSAREHPYFIDADQLALLLDVADVVLTKPGGGTVAEVAYRGAPVVFDATDGLLHWEEFNVKQFVDRHRGVRLESGDLSSLQTACQKAMALGRSLTMVEEQDGHGHGQVLNSSDIIQATLRKLL